MNDPQILADLAAASTRMAADVDRATHAVQRTNRAVAADLTLTSQQGQGFHPGGHREATPKPGSDGGAALAALRALHESFTVPGGTDVVPVPTKDERDLALAHVQGGCSLCAAWLNGLARGARGGAAIQRQRAARQRRPPAARRPSSDV
jgi:hypothetical protein